MQKITPKMMLILALEIVVAILHVSNLGKLLGGTWHDLYSSYFSDLVLPFALYFLLCASETNIPILRHWWLKAGLVFGAALSAEILQFFGVDALGVTFDPVDIVAYACGVLLAVGIERGILARNFQFWTK